MPCTKENIDYVAELAASRLLINNKQDDSRLFVHLLGVFRRFFSSDIENIEIRRNNGDIEELHVFLNREGLYDLLPEGFFHGSSLKYFKDRKETIEELHRHKSEEKNARLFFMPVEQEFFKHLINKEIFEQNFFHAPETIKEFIDFFDLNHLELTTYQKAALFFILPHISRIAGNLKLTEACFEIILQEQVRIYDVYRPQAYKVEDETLMLHENRLGVNTVIGNCCIDQNSQIVIEIGPLLDSCELISYITGKKLEIVNRLTELFIQADLLPCIKVFLKEDDEHFILGERNFESRLNYSTML